MTFVMTRLWIQYVFLCETMDYQKWSALISRKKWKRNLLDLKLYVNCTSCWKWVAHYDHSEVTNVVTADAIFVIDNYWIAYFGSIYSKIKLLWIIQWVLRLTCSLSLTNKHSTTPDRWTFVCCYLVFILTDPTMNLYIRNLIPTYQSGRVGWMHATFWIILESPAFQTTSSLKVLH